MLDQFKVCYHGTTTVQQVKIMEHLGIQLSYSAKATDFGQGFYVTSNFDQAKQWARRKAMKERSEYSLKNNHSQKENISDFIKPVVLEYKVNIKHLADLKGHVFKEPDGNWSTFILKNRKNPISYTELFYDYVVGPVADGNVFRIMMDLEHNRITEDAFHEKIIPKGKMKHFNQMSFNSKKAVLLLHYKGSELV